MRGARVQDFGVAGGPASAVGCVTYRDDDGHYYLRARVYDPAAGGFTSQDPALATSGEAYGYGNSSPTVFNDITGTTATPNGLTGLDDGSGNVVAVDTATTYDPAFAFRDGLPKCSGWSKSLKLGIGIAALIPFGGGILKGAKGFVKACKRCIPGGASAGQKSLNGLSPAVRTEIDDAIKRARQGKIRFPRHDGERYWNRKNELPECGNYTEWTAAGAGQKRGTHRVIIDGDPTDPDAIYYWDHVNPPVRIRP